MVEINTEFGAMKVLLYDETPIHRDNFIKLAEEGYFDGLLFHRVIQGFMIQGGDPNSRDASPNQPLGSGGPDYTLEAEFVDGLYHTRGALAAARTGDSVNPEKRSSGSQFYIVQGAPLTMNQLAQIEQFKGITYPDEVRQKYLREGGTPQLDNDYTVFGQVVEGLEVIDQIAAQPKGPYDRPSRDISMTVRVIK